MKYTFVKNTALRGSLFLFLFILCAAAGAQNEWNPLSSGDDLTGTWEGAQVMQIPRNEEGGIPRSSLKVVFSMVHVRGSETVTLVINMDFDQFLNDMIAVPQFKQAGITKDQLWGMFTGEFQNSLEGAAFHGYSMTYELSDTVESFIEEAAGVVEINRRRNKLKIRFPEPVSLGLGDEGFQEVILDKKR